MHAQSGAGKGGRVRERRNKTNPFTKRCFTFLRVLLAFRKSYREDNEWLVREFCIVKGIIWDLKL